MFEQWTRPLLDHMSELGTLGNGRTLSSILPLEGEDATTREEIQICKGSSEFV